jgi:hypothetical protein
VSRRQRLWWWLEDYGLGIAAVACSVIAIVVTIAAH